MNASSASKVPLLTSCLNQPLTQAEHLIGQYHGDAHAVVLGRVEVQAT